MAQNQLTLIVDGNWLLMTQIFVCSKDLCQDTPESYKKLHKNIINAINNILEKLHWCDNWVLVADDGSWRKKLPIPDCVNAQYKGQRVKDSKLNWEKIEQVWTAILDDLKANGVTVSRAPEIEGDDWCAYWVGRLNKEGISTILWTRDHDLQQLVNYNDNTFTGWYNDHDGIVLNKTAQTESEFFKVITKSRILLERILTFVSDITYINPLEDILIPKVINGDVSDNIKPIIYNIKNGRIFRLPKNELPFNLNLNDLEEIHNFISDKLKNPKYQNLNLNDVKQHFEYNKRLVILESKYYPTDVKQTMIRSIPQYKIAPQAIDYKPIEFDLELINIINNL